MQPLNLNKDIYKSLLIIASIAIYTLLFFILLPSSGEKVTLLSFIPLVVISLFYGLKKGLLTALLLIVLNMVYFYLGGADGASIMLKNTLGALGTFVIAAGIGYMSDLNKKIKENVTLLVQEIATRKKVEKNLRQSEAKYRMVVENINEVVFKANNKGEWTFLNPAWETVTGVTAADTTGKLITEYLYTDDAEIMTDRLNSILNRKEKEFYKLVRIKDKNGNYKWTNLYVSLDEDGFFGTLADVTEIIKVQEDIKTALKKEKEVNDLKSRFITVISHEFRTPLTVILSSAELLQKYPGKWDSNKREEILGRIQNSVEHLNSIISDLAVLNKTSEVNAAPGTVLIDFVAFCKDSITVAKASAKQEYNFHFESPADEIYGNFDAGSLKYIMKNILSNAMKFSPGGGNIYCTLTAVNRKILITVSDEGIGIPDDEQKNIFIPFFRGKNTGAIPGTGLGLSVIKELLKLYGGQICFESIEDKGTTFYLEFPS